MAWITITVADLNDHKIAELVAALREEALADGQTDPMPGIITETVNELRGAIAFSGKYQLDAVTTSVPASFREMIAKKIIRVMKGRLEMPLSKDETADAETYETRLKDIVKGAWPVETPDTPIAVSPVQAQSGVEQASAGVRRVTSAKLSGL